MPTVPELLRTGETHSPILNPTRPSAKNIMMAAAIAENNERMKLAEQTTKKNQLGPVQRK